MTNLDSLLKCRHHFGSKGPTTQSYVFSSSHVQMWDLDHREGWEPKNWCFKLWCWRRFLRVSWTGRISYQPILKEISPEYSLKGLMLKLKLQYFGYLMQRADSLEKTLMLGRFQAGGEGDNRGWDCWMVSQARWTGVWAISGIWWWTGRPGVLQCM